MDIELNKDSSTAHEAAELARALVAARAEAEAEKRTDQWTSAIRVSLMGRDLEFLANLSAVLSTMVWAFVIDLAEEQGQPPKTVMQRVFTEWTDRGVTF